MIFNVALAITLGLAASLCVDGRMRGAIVACLVAAAVTYVLERDRRRNP